MASTKLGTPNFSGKILARTFRRKIYASFYKVITSELVVLVRYPFDCERAHMEEVYADFDPFSGQYSMSVMGGDYVAWSRQKRPLTDVGFVLGRYFLASEFDKDDVAEFDTFIPEEHKKGYKRNRIKKLYPAFPK